MPASDDRTLTRRELLASATALSAAVLVPSEAEQGALGAQLAEPAIPLDPTKAPGPPTSAASARSPFVQMARTPTGAIAGSSLAPIHLMNGTMTPTDVHFERHHAGVALIDPARYKLMIHGLVEKPLVFTLDELNAGLGAFYVLDLVLVPLGSHGANPLGYCQFGGTVSLVQAEGFPE